MRALHRCVNGLAILAVLALLSGAAAPPTHGGRTTITRDPEIAPPLQGGAVLVLTREGYVRATPMKQKNLFLDGMPLGLLDQRTMIVTRIAAGAHHLAASSDCAPLAFYASPGETRLFRLRESLDPLKDVVSTAWIEDDPSDAPGLIERAHLRETRLTDAGMHYLDSRRHLVEEPAPGVMDQVTGDVTADSVVFEHILFESPLDPVNVRKQFETHPGTLTLSHAGLTWRTGDFVFALPWEQVRRLQFSGNRFFEERPWVGFRHGLQEPPLMASFTDDRDDHADATYARIYEIGQRYWRQVHTGAVTGR